MAFHAENSGDLNEAKIHFQKATDVEQNFAEAYFNLARLSSSPSEYDLAERNFETALEIKNEYDECHYYFGKLLAKGERMSKDGTIILQPDPEEASKHFQNAIRINPKNFKSFYELGILLANQKKFVESFEALQKAITINPNFADGHYQLAVLLMNQSAQCALAKIRKPSAKTKVNKKTQKK